MKLEKYLYLVLILLICLISISAVSAANDSESDIISADENEELFLEESVNDDVINDNNYDDEVILEENDELALDIDEKPALGEGETTTGSFTDLNTTINGNDNDTINLESDYAYTEDDAALVGGILITRSVTINGNGHTIDGAHSTRIFYINANDVIINNLNFKNGNAIGGAEDGYGGAIYWDGNNGVLNNSNFTNNRAPKWGGAIFWSINGWNPTGEISYSNFYYNTASEYGGAIFWDPDLGSIHDSCFSNNTADNGGAIELEGEYVTVSKNTFSNNTADNGGAIYVYYNSYPMVNNNFFLTEKDTLTVIDTANYDVDFNWFGNVASNYTVKPNEFCNKWLFLNATANPSEIVIDGESEVILKMFYYDWNLYFMGM